MAFDSIWFTVQQSFVLYADSDRNYSLFFCRPLSDRLPFRWNLTASNRAVRILGESGILSADELSMTRKVLGAAALTYVAGAASAILQLLRIILLTGGRRRE